LHIHTLHRHQSFNVLYSAAPILKISVNLLPQEAYKQDYWHQLNHPLQAIWYMYFSITNDRYLYSGFTQSKESGIQRAVLIKTFWVSIHTVNPFFLYLPDFSHVIFLFCKVTTPTLGLILNNGLSSGSPLNRRLIDINISLLTPFLIHYRYVLHSANICYRIYPFSSITGRAAAQ